MTFGPCPLIGCFPLAAGWKLIAYEAVASDMGLDPDAADTVIRRELFVLFKSDNTAMGTVPYRASRLFDTRFGRSLCRFLVLLRSVASASLCGSLASARRGSWLPSAVFLSRRLLGV